MSEFSERLLTEPARKRVASPQFRPALLILAPVAALLFQVYLQRFFHYLSYLEFPLLVTIYFALMQRQAIPGLLFGATVGLLQDCLSTHEIGLYGIVKTLVGYFAASVSQRFDVDNQLIRLILSFFFFCFHQFFYWVLSRALLGQQVSFDVPQTLIFGFLNAAVALPLFQLLDKLKE